MELLTLRVNLVDHVMLISDTVHRVSWLLLMPAYLLRRLLRSHLILLLIAAFSLALVTILVR